MDNNNFTTTLSTRKRGKHPSFEDRCTIRVLHQQRNSLRKIAKQLNCSPSTTMYELRRGTAERKPGSGRPPVYKPSLGQSVYDENCKRCNKPFKLKQCQKFINEVVENFIDNGWSIDESVGSLKLSEKYSISETVSTKTMYNYVWKVLIQLKPIDLPETVKRDNLKRIRVSNNKHIQWRSIEERPAHISEYIEIGH